MAKLKDLPAELHIMILLHLKDLTDHIVAARACTFWRSILPGPEIQMRQYRPTFALNGIDGSLLDSHPFLHIFLIDKKNQLKMRIRDDKVKKIYWGIVHTDSGRLELDVTDLPFVDEPVFAIDKGNTATGLAMKRLPKELMLLFEGIEESEGPEDSDDGESEGGSEDDDDNTGDYERPQIEVLRMRTSFTWDLHTVKTHAQIYTSDIEWSLQSHTTIRELLQLVASELRPILIDKGREIDEIGIEPFYELTDFEVLVEYDAWTEFEHDGRLISRINTFNVTVMDI